MKHIFVVDDDRFNLRIAEDTLSSSYEVSTATSGEDALLWLESNNTDLILMDIEMKGMNGIDTVRLIKEDGRWTHIPVVFLTASSDPQIELTCLQCGADDFIAKPFSPTVMKSRVDHVMELYNLRYGLEQQLQEKTKQVEMVTMHSIMSIANTIDAKDKYTSGHSIRVAKCAVAIAKKLGWTAEEQQNLQYVALLHDIGKIGVPDTVLNKPSRLDDNEFDMIKKHPVIGGEILNEIHVIPHVREGALFHHERYDGTGYPSGLKGRDIPLYARIVCIADAYDAMSMDRVYRKKITNEQIIAEYEKCKGKQFDPYLTDLFIEMLQDNFDITKVDAFEGEDEAGEPGEKSKVSSIILKQHTKEIANVAMTDSLTGLYSRSYAQSHVDEMLHGSPSGALLMLDMDNFKKINREYGHIIGDQVLKIFSSVIKKSATGSDILCRVGGDEFIMFMPNTSDRAVVEELAHKIIDSFTAEMNQLDLNIELSISVGYALAKEGDDFEFLYDKASKALYFAEQSGKNEIHCYDNGGVAGSHANSTDLNDIRQIVLDGVNSEKGAYHLAYAEFQKVYNFIASHLDQTHTQAQILLLTIKSHRNNEAIITDSDVIACLEKAISTSLRNEGVYTRYSSSQYIVVLLDSDTQNGEVIAERISTAFGKLQADSHYILQMEFCDMS